MRKVFTLFALITAVLATGSFAQERTVKGVVKSESGEPLPGVNVVIDGTTTGTITDLDGNYSISANDNTTLVFSFIGFEEKKVQIGSRTVVDVTLAEDVQSLDAVVVTALGISQTKKSLANAVQEVGGKELQQSKEPNVIQALSGKVAGVQVTSQGGSAGAGSSILIRGNASLTRGNQPLFVVDGVPINNSFTSTTGTGAGVDVANRAIDINSADVESMTVLKGPAATALYGVQGANGVIVITTKKGFRTDTKQTQINFSSSYSQNKILNYFDQQNIYGQGDKGVYSDESSNNHFGAPVSTLRYDGSENNPKDTRGFIVDMNDPSAKADLRVVPFDNQKEFFQTGNTFENNLSVTNSNKNGSYYFSVGHLNQEGIVPNNVFERFTAKFTGDASVTEKLNITASVTYSNSQSVKFGKGDNFSDVVQGTIRVPITFQNSAGHEFANGEQRNWLYVEGKPFEKGPDNPYWTVNKNPYNDEVNRMIAYFQTKYEFTPWLSLMHRLGTDVFSDKRNQVWATGSKGEDSRFPGSTVTGRLLEDTYIDKTVNSDLFLTATKRIGNDFDLSLMVGQNYYSSSGSRQYITGYNFGIPGLYNIGNTTEGLQSIESTSAKKTAAVFSRFSAGWRGIIYAEFNARNEWTSTLAANNKSFAYGSANASFIFTEILDISKDILSFGKIRASVARAGTDAPRYILQTYYVNGGASTDFGAGVTFPIRTVGGVQLENVVGNSSLRPEQTDAIELGTELMFVNNRFSIDFTYYKSVSTDQIVRVQVPGSSGVTAKYINSGKVENKGIEIVLGATPVRTNSFQWDITANFTRNRNLVVSLPVNNFTGLIYGSLFVRQQPGMPFNSYYGTRFTRHENGEILIDASGFPSQDGEQGFIGNPNPDYLLGIRNSFDFKGLTLSFFWDIRKGGDVANVTTNWLRNVGVGSQTEDRGHVVVFNGVTADGSPNTKQVVLDQAYYNSSAGSRSIAERYIEDGSWVRLRDVTLGYSLPKNIVEKAKMANLNISVYGRNLLLFTKYSGMDPDTNLGGVDTAPGVDAFVIPNTKSYGVTLSGRF